MPEVFAGAFARHLYQSQRRKVAHVDAGRLRDSALFEFFQHGIAMLRVVHVDEVTDDDAAKIAQPQLPCNDARRLQIGLEDGIVKIAQPDKAAGVDVYGGQRLGLVYDQIATRLQVDTLGQGALYLFLDVIHVEQGACTGMVF